MNDEHIIETLFRLRRAVDAAIDSVKRGEMRSCTPAEEADHAKRYGEGAWTLGEFVITDRNGQPRASKGAASAFDPFIPSRPHDAD